MKHLFVTGMMAATLVFGTPALAKDVALNLSNEYSAVSIHGVGDARFAEAVKSATNGSVDIVVHYGGALGYKSADHFDAVGEGALAIADTYSGALGGIDPLFLISSLPFLATTVEEARTLYEVSKADIEKVFADNDQILLYASPWPPSGLWARDPMNNLAALSGVKIRTFDKNSTEALSEAGAAAIRLSWGDVVPSISTGAIEAVLTTAETGAGASFWEYFDTFTEIYGYSMPLNYVHMNKDVFDSLTKDQQDAILSAAEKTSDANWSAIPSRLKETYAQLKTNNVDVVTSDDETYRAELQAAGKVAIDSWLAATGDRGQALLDAFYKASSH
ncbi:TRAP transporter substrate-binding protein [Limibacillus sp. MBR-115]|jgi:TRAP-type C4-dicarboxylate transport system substrate-binding protein|uniref:TRAP transporter substrate-binding protein n=1 Tax=Limibacillus sp. MBR-115 TaxID=3156465 RepID=UPI0033953C2D